MQVIRVRRHILALKYYFFPLSLVLTYLLLPHLSGGESGRCRGLSDLLPRELGDLCPRELMDCLPLGLGDLRHLRLGDLRPLGLGDLRTLGLGDRPLLMWGDILPRGLGDRRMGLGLGDLLWKRGLGEWRRRLGDLKIWVMQFQSTTIQNITWSKKTSYPWYN